MNIYKLTLVVTFLVACAAHAVGTVTPTVVPDPQPSTIDIVGGNQRGTILDDGGTRLPSLCPTITIVVTP